MINFFKQYIPYYKGYVGKFILVFIGVILVAVGTSGTAYIIEPLLDKVFIEKDREMLQIVPLIVILLYTAKGVGRFLQAYYTSYIGQDIVRKVRDKLLSHIMNLDLMFFNSKHSGELVSRITNDINRIQAAVSNQIARMIQELLTVMALVGVVIYQSPKLAFYGLIVMPLVIFPLSRLAKRMKKLSFKSQERNSDILAHLNEIFNNIEIIKASSSENLESSKFKVHNYEFFKVNLKGVKTNELVSPLMEIVGAIAIAIVITVGGNEVIEGRMSVGTFFSFMTALFMLYTPLKSLSSLYNQFQDALAANQRINDLFAIKAEIKSGEKDFTDGIDKISVDNLVLKYGEKTALDGVNIKINKGETVAFVGDSGGGKSSMVNALLRFYDTESGNITINDTNLKDIKIDSLRKSISIVTQKTYIFNDTIGKNITYGLEYDEEKIHKILKLVNASTFVNDLPDGIDTILDESGTNLSGGQKQRIAIARALYRNPKILILDEATSALDNKSESVITELLDTVTKDIVTIIIAHRLSTIKYANNIFFFKKGKIINQGSEEYLLENCEEYKKLYELSSN